MIECMSACACVDGRGNGGGWRLLTFVNIFYIKCLRILMNATLLKWIEDPLYNAVSILIPHLFLISPIVKYISKRCSLLFVFEAIAVSHLRYQYTTQRIRKY